MDPSAQQQDIDGAEAGSEAGTGRSSDLSVWLIWAGIMLVAIAVLPLRCGPGWFAPSPRCAARYLKVNNGSVIRPRQRRAEHDRHIDIALKIGIF